MLMLTQLVDVFLLTVPFPYHPWMVYLYLTLPKKKSTKCRLHMPYMDAMGFVCFFRFLLCRRVLKMMIVLSHLHQRDMLVPRRAPVTYLKAGPQLVVWPVEAMYYTNPRSCTSFFANASCIHSKIPSMVQLQNKTVVLFKQRILCCC